MNDSGGDPVDPDPDPVGSTSFTASVTTAVGQEVYVVGSIPQPGSWNPASGLKLSTNAAAYPSWTGSLDIPAGTSFEWKLVKIGNGAATWEGIGNRAGGGATAFNVTWNTPGG